MQVSVEQIGKCETCGKLFDMKHFSPHQIADKWECCICHNPLGWVSLGMQNVGVGGVYEKVRWIDPKGMWTEEKPTHSFRLEQWDVTSDIVFHRQESKLPPEATRLYVAWCQKWCIRNKDSSLTQTAHSLHKNKTQAYMFTPGVEFEGFIRASEPYKCLISATQFEEVRTRDAADGAICYLSICPPEPYEEDMGDNVYAMIVAA